MTAIKSRVLPVIMLFVFASCAKPDYPSSKEPEPATASVCQFTDEHIYGYGCESADAVVADNIANTVADVAADAMPKFFRKYRFNFWRGDFDYWADYVDGTVGRLETFMWCCSVEELNCDCDEEEYLRPNTGGTGSDHLSFRITEDDSGRLLIHPFGHDGWPGVVVDNAEKADENLLITVFVEIDNRVLLMSNTGVLSQMPEVLADGFYVRTRGRGEVNEFISIEYHEREDSVFWAWLMHPDNAWQLNVRNRDSEIVADVTVAETTGDLWSEWSIQSFEWGGDTTLVSRRGILSQIPELHDDILYFQLVTQGDFEMQYIMFHEREGSKLWQILGKYIAPLTIPYSWLE
ncbi:MAG: hypothetical protein FWC70_13050 [Defluviitaleaceae bacterium]|nr:hypothetical protein [Defluviitaleaceae bacterium]